MTDDTGTLLVVDDSETNRDLLSRRLERKGYRVLTAESGPQALEIVSRERVDVVLLDIMMPGMNGMDVLRALRRTHSPEELTVIMVTAKTESEDIVDALEEGANDYVVKPIDFPVCLARVQAQLRLRRGAPAAPAKPETIGVGTVLAPRRVRHRSPARAARRPARAHSRRGAPERNTRGAARNTPVRAPRRQGAAHRRGPARRQGHC